MEEIIQDEPPDILQDLLDIETEIPIDNIQLIRDKLNDISRTCLDFLPFEKAHLVQSNLQDINRLLYQLSPSPQPNAHGIFNISDHLSTSKHKCLWEGCKSDITTWTRKGEDMRNHIMTQHVETSLSNVAARNKRQQFICKWENCMRKKIPFARKHGLMTHLSIHTGEKKFACPVEGCRKSFSRNDSLQNHLKTHSSSSSS